MDGSIVTNSNSAALIFQWWWMLLLLPLPWIYRALRKPAPQNGPGLIIPVYQQLLGATENSHGKHSSVPLQYVLLIIIWLSCLLAASRPIWIGEPIELPTTGRDLLLVVDLSGSMKERDMPLGRDMVARIMAAKAVVGQFVERRSGDRLGLILFADQPYLQSPLTFDRKTLNQLLQEAQLGMAGERTAIGDAIGLGVKQLKERPENHRVMILLTDGANSAGNLNPLQAADAAAQLDIKIYTVGIGGGGSGWFSRNEVDEETLLAIAEKTGGQFYRAHDVNQLNKIYMQLDQLEPIEQQTETLRPTRSLFHWPLSAALLATLILLLCRATRGGNHG